MKTTNKLITMALIAIIGIAILALPLTGCGGDDGGGTTDDNEKQTATYTAYDAESNFYTLEITKQNANKAAYAPKKTTRLS